MESTYTFQQLFAEQLSDVYVAEQQIEKILAPIIEVTSSGKLREAFGIYQLEVTHHLEGLKAIFEELQIPVQQNNTSPVSGILAEVARVMKHRGNSAVKDASLIAVVQCLQHFKMATYGTLRTFARHLSYNKAMDFLQRALISEHEADRKLTHLAEGGLFTSGINDEALKK